MQRQRVLLPIDGHVIAADVHLLPDPRPPVVFLHGAMTSLDLATSLFAAPDEESWIAISLPGHAPGRFAWGSAGPRIDAPLFGHLLEAALAILVGDRQVIIAGWSLGGFAALNHAIRFPRRVAAVASFAGFTSGRRLGGAIAAVTWLADRPLGRAAVVRGLGFAGRWPPLHRLVAGSMTAPGRRMSPEMLSSLHAAYQRHEPTSLAAVLAAIRRLDISAEAAEIHAPTWIAGGALDPVVPVAETRRMKSLIPHAALTIYPAAGHLFYDEWPAARADFAAWRRQLAIDIPSGKPRP